MLLDWLAIAVSVLLSAGIRNAWAITLGIAVQPQGRLIASYLTELVLQGCTPSSECSPVGKRQNIRRSSLMSDLNLAVIGNSAIAALVDRRARIVWCCFPRFDGDPIFCSLLEVADDPTGAGLFDIELTNLESAKQEYVRNTAILVTTLTDDAGATVQITDLAPRFRHYGRLFRPTILVRRVAPLAGSPRLRIRVRPRSDYGATPMGQILGSNHIRYISSTLALRLTTDAPISYVAEEVPFVLEGPVNLILGPDERITAPIAATTREYFELTQDYWFEWTRYLSVPFEWQDAVIRAAIVLKLCSFEETGAIVAALTTSIPEAPNSGRTWDYRYCWLRDAYLSCRR